MKLLFALIDTLKNYTSNYGTGEKRTLTRSELVKIIKKNYSAENVTDKKIRVRLDAICDYEADLKEEDRTIGYREYFVDGGNQLRRTDYYYNNSITDVEYAYIVDSIMTSKIFNTDTANRLANKVKKMGGKKLKDMTPYANESYGKQRYILNTDVLDNIYNITEAIKYNAFIEFDWNVYDVVNGNVGLRFLERRTLKPIRLMLNEGRYYMMARYYKSSKIYTYSVDLMKDISIKKAYNDDIKEYDLEKNFIRAIYILSHPYNMGGKIKSYKLRVNREYFSRLVDTFSYQIKVIGGTETETTVDVRVPASADGMKYWLLHNYEVAELIDNSDMYLQEELKKAINILYNIYID